MRRGGYDTFANTHFLGRTRFHTPLHGLINILTGINMQMQSTTGTQTCFLTHTGEGRGLL